MVKIRSGFVTNSSSSSFVIGFKADGIKEIEQTLDQVPAIFKSSFILVKKLFNFDDAVASIEDLNVYFHNNFGSKNESLEDILEGDEWLQEKYETMSRYIEMGYGIIEMSVDYGDETLEELLSNLPCDNSEIILIDKDY